MEEYGLQQGDMVASFMSASQEHLEVYLGVPYLGCILHTINIRLHADVIAQLCSEAGDKVFIVDSEMFTHFMEVVPLLSNPSMVILVGEAPEEPLIQMGIKTVKYEDLISKGKVDCDRNEVDENIAAILCHTGGTTGLPKGVVYSHRFLWLQALSLCTGNSLAISSSDRLLPAVPFFHVNGWGIPFAAFMAGASLILPGANLKPDVLTELIKSEQPTIGIGVPTIWTDLNLFLGSDAANTLQSLKKIATGGAFVTPSLIEIYASFGIEVVQV